MLSLFANKKISTIVLLINYKFIKVLKNLNNYITSYVRNILLNLIQFTFS